MGKFRTDFLTAKSTVITGLGTILNVPGNFYEYNMSRTPKEANLLALKEDWGVIGQDLNEAFTLSINEVRKQLIKAT